VATTDVHQIRGAAHPPVFLLPAVLFVVLFGVAVLLALVAPSRVTSGVYQVVVGDGAAVVPTEALTCARAADTATCTARVGTSQLTIDVHYTGTPEPGRCTARHGDREVTCSPALGYYGHTSQTVWIADDLGLSRTQLADLDAAAPWWRQNYHLTTGMLIMTGALGAAAGATTFLLYRRFRPVPPDRWFLLVLSTAVLASALFAGTGLVFGSSGVGPLMMLSPLALLASAMMAAWQWQLAAIRGGRVVSAVVAAVVVAFYTWVAMFVFLMQSGFED
jgi:hypothetical protein